MKARDRGVAAALSLSIAAVAAFPMFDWFQGPSIDALFVLRDVFTPARHEPDASNSVVIAIDEETYRAPPFEGKPKVLWTKDIALVLDAVVGGGAKVVGWDIVLSTSVEPLLKRFDRDLRLVLRRASRDDKIVLGMVQHSARPIVPSIGYRIAVGHQKNIRMLNVVEDRDGIVRRMPLLFRVSGGQGGVRLMPSMSLEIARRMSGGNVGIERDGSISLGDYAIPARRDPGMTVDRNGANVALRNDAMINFDKGPASIPTYSMADLRRCVGDGDTAYFKRHFSGKAVLFGTVLDVEDRMLTSIRRIPTRFDPHVSARCALDPSGWARPKFDRQSIPGVYIHAAMINNLLRRDALVEPAVLWQSLMIGVLVLACGALTMATSSRRSGAVFAFGTVVWIVVAVAAFTAGYVLPLLHPIVAGALVMGGLLGYRFAVADRLQRHIQSAFGHFVAPSIVERMVVENAMPEQGGELRDMSVWISDLEGYSTIAERMPPAELIKLLNEVYTVMCDTVEECGGFVAQFVGDAVVAGFGAPMEDPEHARHAVQSALMCDLRVRALAERLTLPDGLRLRNRIGISSGELLVGNIGSARRLSYTIVGDDINLASRLEGANKVYGSTILVNGATRELCGDGFEFREIDIIRVKGRDTPVRIFEPLSSADVAARGSALATFADALRLFRELRFAEARETFATIAEHDPVARSYVDRIDDFAAEPPPEDWDGVNNLTTK